MVEEIATIRDGNARLEELRTALTSIGKESLIDRKEQIKKLAREHRNAGTLENKQLDDSIAEIEEINGKIKEAEKIEDEIRSLESQIKIAQEKVSAENQQNQNRSIEKTMENVNIRHAFAKYVLFESTHRADAKLTEMEMRKLGVATTTTSETYVAPSASLDGVNNGGIFIPQEVMLDILRETEIESPIYRDVVTTAIKGMVKFPVRLYMSEAKAKAELSPTENKSVQWGLISGAIGNYTDSIVLTFEIEAMSIPEFADYLISLIGESMRELVIHDYIYGDGANDHVKGITLGAIDGSYAATITDMREALEAGIKALPDKARGGAKIYVSSDIYDSITFAKNKNGDYILPVLNGGGLTKMSSFPVEADPNLAAGHFIIGNVSKNYKANVIKPLELGLDVSNQHRTKTYTSHFMISAVPVPNSFVYGKKKTTT